MTPSGGKYHKGINTLYKDDKGESSVFFKEETWACFFTPNEILEFFKLADSEALTKDIEDFCKWLDHDIKVFIINHIELCDKSPEEEKNLPRFHPKIRR